jgi:lysophospholipase L1-like esterase
MQILRLGLDISNLFSTGFAWWQRIDAINAIMKAIAATDPMLSYLDCSSVFLTNGGANVNQTLFFDVIHPNAAGSCRA